MSKKNAIMEAALCLFEQKGYALTTIDEIAKASGMTKPSFYKYFPGKEDLLLEVLKQFSEDLEGKVYRLYRTAEISKNDRIIELVMIYLEDIFKHRAYMNFFTELSQPFYENEQIQNAAMTIERKIFTWLQESIVDLYGEKMEGFSVDVTFIATSVLMDYTRVAGPSLSHDHCRRIAVYIEYLIGVLVEGLKTNRPNMPLLFETPSWILNYWPEEITPILRSRQLQQLFRRMESIVKKQASLSEAERKDYLQAIGEIRKETKDSLLQNVITKSLMYYLERVDALRDECAQLRLILEPEGNSV
ncbi:TetR/AcrR family transcriptional regulator [Paenibacillus phocaensis]|uniref:TetR/AcrR family transcriptional regulator n=1 Tax=Paenibacillus phocaensis TaxID=1776378 RepID=UPI00039B42FA|nr:TetR/AcrR family transcriptional regulator [Paenibacillus phocaensis]